ncbi:hypothetical protein HP532_12680 [Pseudomonas sp. CrR25]|nr:hypothetical protein [Pseudomonas sp. CrR25]
MRIIQVNQADLPGVLGECCDCNRSLGSEQLKQPVDISANLYVGRACPKTAAIAQATATRRS